MSNENINILSSNFCIGPVAGTFCTIDTTNPSTVLSIKNSTGGTFADYTLSSNIINTLVGIEYVGPTNMSYICSGVTFFTVEYINSSKSLLKRWELDEEHSQLDLKGTMNLINTGSYYFDVNAMAVEYHKRTVGSRGGDLLNYFDINNVAKISTGLKVILGPSSDTDNLGAIEEVTVSHVDTLNRRVYTTSNLKYQYVTGDQVSFYNSLYIFSRKGISGDNSKGTIFKINPYNNTIISTNTDGWYKNISTSKWCPYAGTIAAVCGTNMLFINPDSYYSNWSSHFLNNVENDKVTSFDIVDVVFDGSTIYKLSNKATFRDDEGTLSTNDWAPYYNFQQDSIVPYVNNIVLYSEKEVLIGQNQDTTIKLQVRDQHGVGLRDVDVTLTIEDGDVGAALTPLSGQVTTDVNGEASILYTSGNFYNGLTTISAVCFGGSSYTGSGFVWASIKLMSRVSVDDVEIKCTQLKEVDIDAYLMKQLHSTFKIKEPEGNSTEYVLPFTKVRSRNFFTSPGGDWVYGGDTRIVNQLSELGVVNLPSTDGLRRLFLDNGSTTSCWPFPTILDGTPPFSIFNRVTFLEEFNSQNSIITLKDFYVEWDPELGPLPPYNFVFQRDILYNLQLSQAKHSRHTYWVDGTSYDYVWTYVDSDQFVFISDAIPPFFSYKNPISTNIWLRMRPFAFNLNADTLVFKVREISVLGVGGWIDVSNKLSINYFDAGGGLLGIEVLYDPSEDFNYDAVIHVSIEIYDEAPSPNYISTEYWFRTIPDYFAPYLINRAPAPEDNNVPVDSLIYFEIMDMGTGIDINTLDVTLNDRRIVPQNITMINKNHYTVSYTPIIPLQYNKEFSINVKVSDRTVPPNWMNTSYRFFTVIGDGVYFINEIPLECERGVSRFSDVSVLALSSGGGIDLEKIRIQVQQKDVTNKSSMLPVLYRIS